MRPAAKRASWFGGQLSLNVNGATHVHFRAMLVEICSLQIFNKIKTVQLGVFDGFYSSQVGLLRRYRDLALGTKNPGIDMGRFA